MKVIARLFKALSDETRLRILCLLLEGELCVCDIMAVLQLPQSTVSRHLAYLKNAGW
nr:metalloregulator ArsR/SmtB family transcription factor [Gammaproteobacteria bacterium]